MQIRNDLLQASIFRYTYVFSQQFVNKFFKLLVSSEVIKLFCCWKWIFMDSKEVFCVIWGMDLGFMTLWKNERSDIFRTFPSVSIKFCLAKLT